MPSSATVSRMPNGTRRAFTFSPRSARNAGSMMTEVSIARVTASVPPMPREGAPVLTKKSMPVSPIATVNPEKKTARPAVADVMARATRIVAIGSLLSIPVDDEEGVIDGDAEAEQGDDVPSEVVDIGTLQRGEPDRDAHCADHRQHTDTKGEDRRDEDPKTIRSTVATRGPEANSEVRRSFFSLRSKVASMARFPVRYAVISPSSSM